MAKQNVCIVGGVAGGASAAARLRRLDEEMNIILFERGDYISFANCGLPYYIGGEIKARSALLLQTPESFRRRFRVDVRMNSEVLHIDRHKNTITVKNWTTGDTYIESYGKLILSTGAEPIKPNIAGLDGIRTGNVFTLRSIPDTDRILAYIREAKPKTAVIAGGGYIGVEMAENLHRNGIAVTLVEQQNQVIAPLDYDMACEVHRYMKSKGICLLLNDGVLAVAENESQLAVRCKSGTVQTDMLLLAVGVRPDTAIARDTGMQMNARGAIVVDGRMRTSVQDIYAVGDAVEVTDFVSKQKAYIPLAGPANKQGRIAADNICGIKSKYEGTQGSSILKIFDMTVAVTGLNEKAVKQQQRAYEKVFTYSASHAGYYPGAVNMSIKTIFDRDSGRLLGAQIVGFDGCDKRCDVLATAIRAGMTAGDLTKLELCYAPPYTSAKDPVNMAGYVAENVLAGLVRQFHWHDVASLPRDGSVLLLDTRTEAEFANGHIDGFMSMPLDELRERLDELDKDKPIYVTCQVGLRGYLACRILSQNGFACLNLSGGYRLYQTIFGKTPAQPELPQEAPKISKQPEIAAAPAAEEKKSPKPADTGKTIRVDACGLQCPEPIMKLSEAMKQAANGDVVEILSTDPAFASDIDGFCSRTGNRFLEIKNEKGVAIVKIRKIADSAISEKPSEHKHGKNFIVFSGDLDKAIAVFIMANAAAALGRRVRIFFTFWGLSILRKPKKVNGKKDGLSKLFAKMTPRGSQKLPLSRMNMGGMGAKLIRQVMKNKHIGSLEDLMRAAMENGVELIACSMSMEVMGLKKAELIDGVKLGGAAAMLAFAEDSDMSLFI